MQPPKRPPTSHNFHKLMVSAGLGLRSAQSCPFAFILDAIDMTSDLPVPGHRHKNKFCFLDRLSGPFGTSRDAA